MFHLFKTSASSIPTIQLHSFNIFALQTKPCRSFGGYLANSAMCTEGTYPYKAVKGNCKIGGCTAAVMAGGVKGYKAVTLGCLLSIFYVFVHV